jgi:hypothetical protein
VYAGAAGLNSATGLGGYFLGHVRKIWYRELVWACVCAPTRVCERPCAREKWIVVR